jgi:hypothetical protein
VRLITSLQVGARYFGCVVCRFHIAASAGSVPCQKPVSNNLQKWFLSPTGQLNFGIITEGKLTTVLITPSSWGSQLVHQHRTISVVLTSSHLQRHCHRLCHARQIIHLPWITNSFANHESRSNSREIVKPKKYIWYTSYKCFMLNTYRIFCVFDTNSCLLENRTFYVRIAWRSLWHMLMEIKLLMAMNAVPPYLLSGLVIEKISWSIMVEDLICVSCFWQDKVMVTLWL